MIFLPPVSISSLCLMTRLQLNFFHQPSSFPVLCHLKKHLYQTSLVITATGIRTLLGVHKFVSSPLSPSPKSPGYADIGILFDPKKECFKRLEREPRISTDLRFSSHRKLKPKLILKVILLLTMLCTAPLRDIFSFSAIAPHK